MRKESSGQGGTLWVSAVEKRCAWEMVVRASSPGWSLCLEKTRKDRVGRSQERGRVEKFITFFSTQNLLIYFS